MGLFVSWFLLLYVYKTLNENVIFNSIFHNDVTISILKSMLISIDILYLYNTLNNQQLLISSITFNSIKLNRLLNTINKSIIMFYITTNQYEFLYSAILY